MAGAMTFVTGRSFPHRLPAARSLTGGGIITDPCEMDQPVNADGQFCGVSVQFSPFAPAGPFRTEGARFQSNPGTGESSPITITFSRPVTSVSVTAYDPTFDGNEMVGRDVLGGEVGRSAFPGNHQPGAITAQTERMDGAISSSRSSPARLSRSLASRGVGEAESLTAHPGSIVLRSLYTL